MTHRQTERRKIRSTDDAESVKRDCTVSPYEGSQLIDIIDFKYVRLYYKYVKYQFS